MAHKKLLFRSEALAARAQALVEKLHVALAKPRGAFERKGVRAWQCRRPLRCGSLWEGNLLLRDFLRTHLAEAAAYGALKRMAAQEARAQGRYEADLIREAVSLYTRSQPRPRPKSLGIARGPKNLAARTDELLAEGFGTDDGHR